MDFASIKDILKKEKSKVILVEDGKPSYVIIPIEEYYKLLIGDLPTEDKAIEDVNKRVEELNHEDLVLFDSDFIEKQEIKIEDLPF